MRTRMLCVLGLCLLAAGCGKKEKTTAELVGDLKGSQDKDRVSAARLLPQRRGEGAAAIPALIEALKDKDYAVRRSAALGLGSFGEQAKDAIPALQAARNDPDARVREAVAKALSRIDPNLAPTAAPGTSPKQ
jgi:hypothetical protein